MEEGMLGYLEDEELRLDGEINTLMWVENSGGEGKAKDHEE